MGVVMVKNRLKEILDERGIKQKWLADRAGIKQGSLSSIINHKNSTTIEVALAIAKALDMKVEDIWVLE
jgi:DNA-binding XRE family transcriptional regulator